jgi:FMN-dependent NADH-azoreductase
LFQQLTSKQKKGDPMTIQNILKIDASASGPLSVTRELTSKILEKVRAETPEGKTVTRDLSQEPALPFLSPDLVAAFFTPSNERSDEQRQQLNTSDALLKELKQADTIIMGVPMYNFSVPAVLKAYIDQIARVGETFKYTDQGPVGLLEHKKALVAIATGGTPIGSSYDFVKPYLETVLGFIGITDVQFVVIDQRGDREALMQAADVSLQKLVVK